MKKEKNYFEQNGEANCFKMIKFEILAICGRKTEVGYLEINLELIDHVVGKKSGAESTAKDKTTRISSLK